MNPTNFGSPKLDTPISRYEFLKYVIKSIIKIRKSKTHKLTDGIRGQRGPFVSEIEVGTEVDRR